MASQISIYHARKPVAISSHGLKQAKRTRLSNFWKHTFITNVKGRHLYSVISSAEEAHEAKVSHWIDWCSAFPRIAKLCHVKHCLFFHQQVSTQRGAPGLIEGVLKCYLH